MKHIAVLVAFDDDGISECAANFPVICISDHCQRHIVIIGIMFRIESASDDNNNNIRRVYYIHTALIHSANTRSHFKL